MYTEPVSPPLPDLEAQLAVARAEIAATQRDLADAEQRASTAERELARIGEMVGADPKNRNPAHVAAKVGELVAAKQTPAVPIISPDAHLRDLMLQVKPAGAPPAHRRKLPDERNSETHKFTIHGQEGPEKGYVTVGVYEDGSPGEMFIKMDKPGSNVSGLLDSFAIAVSHGLQHGVPLKLFCDKFQHMRFEPAGFTGNPEIPRASSVVDYVFAWARKKFVREESFDAGVAAPSTAA
jgi:hypothetical protein